MTTSKNNHMTADQIRAIFEQKRAKIEECTYEQDLKILRQEQHEEDTWFTTDQVQP